MQATNYPLLLADIKIKIREAQVKATLSANAQMIRMYWDIGNMISQKQKIEGWGASVIAKLSKDLKSEMPELRGFSPRNLEFMLQFSDAYSIPKQAVSELKLLEISKNLIPKQLVSELENNKNSIAQLSTALLQSSKNQQNTIVQQAVAQLIILIPWGHHILLMQKIKDLETRLWYINQTIENGWSREVLSTMIKSKLHERNRSLVNNFDEKLPKFQSELVKQTLKDPYLFDFLTLTEPFAERELEANLIKHIEKFLLELGTGFAYVGRQYHLDVGDQDFYIDLLFYHLKMRCFVVIDLKKGDFKPEYAGKMNFYCSVIDDILKHESDQPTIGMILCENKNKIVAEYTLKGIEKPIGVSEYELTRSLPDNFKSLLPSIEEIENELSNILTTK